MGIVWMRSLRYGTCLDGIFKNQTLSKVLKLKVETVNFHHPLSNHNNYAYLNTNFWSLFCHKNMKLDLIILAS
jgi:hypothetical protein